MREVNILGLIAIAAVIALVVLLGKYTNDVSSEYDNGHNTCQGYVTESCDDLGVFKFDKDLFKCKRLKRPELR